MTKNTKILFQYIHIPFTRSLSIKCNTKDFHAWISTCIDFIGVCLNVYFLPYLQFALVEITGWCKTTSFCTVRHQTYWMSSLVPFRSLVVLGLCISSSTCLCFIGKWPESILLQTGLVHYLMGVGCEYRTTREAEEIIADRQLHL